MPSGKRIPKQKCVHCGDRYTPKRAWQKYCSIECKNNAGQFRLRERAKGNTEATV